MICLEVSRRDPRRVLMCRSSSWAFHVKLNVDGVRQCLGDASRETLVSDRSSCQPEGLPAPAASLATLAHPSNALEGRHWGTCRRLAGVDAIRHIRRIRRVTCLTAGTVRRSGLSVGRDCAHGRYRPLTVATDLSRAGADLSRQRTESLMPKQSPCRHTGSPLLVPPTAPIKNWRPDPTPRLRRNEAPHPSSTDEFLMDALSAAIHNWHRAFGRLGLTLESCGTGWVRAS